MRTLKILCLSVVHLLALAGCGATDSADGPGGVTAGEARALNEAAAMLDSRSDNMIYAQTSNVLAEEGER